MSARQRALVILVSVMAATVGAALLLIARSDSVHHRSGQHDLQVAGTRAVDLALFKDEVLVWAAGGFAPVEVARVRDSSKVAGISAVRTGLLPVASGRNAYPVIPVEAISVDPDAYAAAIGRAGGSFRSMLRRGVVLSRTGASLRKLRQGGHFALTGSRSLTVGGVVDDRLLAGYEAAVDLRRGHRLGIDQVGYLLLRPRGPRDALEVAVRGLLHGRKLGFRQPGQARWLRPGDGTLPLAQVKVRFGEFAVRSLDRPVPDPRWVRANVVARTVPLLGQVRCNRAVIGDLAAALADVRRQHLEALVDAAAFWQAGGCLQPRPERAGPDGLSRRLWGIAFDLTGPGAAAPNQRLVTIMARHGFAWGGRWLRPQAGHFEWAGAGA